MLKLLTGKLSEPSQNVLFLGMFRMLNSMSLTALFPPEKLKNRNEVGLLGRKMGRVSISLQYSWPS